MAASGCSCCSRDLDPEFDSVFWMNDPEYHFCINCMDYVETQFSSSYIDEGVLQR